MGMFDTIHFANKHTCPLCHREIKSLQTKAFKKVLKDYHVRDCVSHADEIRITKDELFCENCRMNTGVAIYLIVQRGILLGTAGSLVQAKSLLGNFNIDTLILWYHDLYQRYLAERREKQSYIRFLNDLSEWHRKRLHEKSEDAAAKDIWFLVNVKHLKGALSPVESVERFMTSKKMIDALHKLWEEGHEVLDIYYAEEMATGTVEWSVDVYQDDLNDRCGLNWTWTVLNTKQLEKEGEKKDELPEWVIVVDEPFSDKVICHEVMKWLQNSGFEFGVKMITAGEARGSGLFKKAQEMKRESSEKDTLTIEAVLEEFDKQEVKRIVELIKSKVDRRRVFYCEGFYGSLVPDVESDELIGKIEGIKESVIYRGKTIKACEQAFREAVLRHMKTEDV